MDKEEYSIEELTAIVKEQQRIIELLKERVIEIGMSMDNDNGGGFRLWSKYWQW